MLIDSDFVHGKCDVQPKANTQAILMAVYPKAAKEGNVYVGKCSITLPANVDMVPGNFYIMRVVDISSNVRVSPVLGESVVMVDSSGEFIKSSFCRIDYSYRAVYKTHLASDVLQAHREADAILTWEESMPFDIRLEYLYNTLKNPSFETFKWKVTTRDIVNGKNVGHVAKLQDMWSRFVAHQGKSDALENWLAEHPLVTPNTNNAYREISSFQQPQPIPQQADFKRMQVRRYPNGYPRRYRGGYQGVPQQQMPCSLPQVVPVQMGMQPVGWHQPMVQSAPQMYANMMWPQQPYAYPQYGNMVAPQPMMPPQCGWPQQPFTGPSTPVFQQSPQEKTVGGCCQTSELFDTKGR